MNFLTLFCRRNAVALLSVAAVLVACDLEKDTGDEDDTVERTCSDVPELDLNAPPPAGETHFLSCFDSKAGAECPDLTSVPIDNLTPPHADPDCGYTVEPVCGPEALIEETCCYEVMIMSEWCK